MKGTGSFANPDGWVKGTGPVECRGHKVMGNVPAVLRGGMVTAVQLAAILCHAQTGSGAAVAQDGVASVREI